MSLWPELQCIYVTLRLSKSLCHLFIILVPYHFHRHIYGIKPQIEIPPHRANYSPIVLYAHKNSLIYLF